MAMPPDYMDGGIAGKHEIPEDTVWGTSDLGRLEIQWASSLVVLALRGPEKVLQWLLSQFLRYSFCTICWTGIEILTLTHHEHERLFFFSQASSPSLPLLSHKLV